MFPSRNRIIQALHVYRPLEYPDSGYPDPENKEIRKKLTFTVWAGRSANKLYHRFLNLHLTPEQLRALYLTCFPCHAVSLPSVLLQHTFTFLRKVDWPNIAQVSKQWHQEYLNPSSKGNPDLSLWVLKAPRFGSGYISSHFLTSLLLKNASHDFLYVASTVTVDFDSECSLRRLMLCTKHLKRIFSYGQMLNFAKLIEKIQSEANESSNSSNNNNNNNNDNYSATLKTHASDASFPDSVTSLSIGSEQACFTSLIQIDTFFSTIQKFTALTAIEISIMNMQMEKWNVLGSGCVCVFFFPSPRFFHREPYVVRCCCSCCTNCCYR